MNIDELPTNRSFILPWTKTSQRIDSDDARAAARLPFLKYLPRGTRGHFVAVLGEFIGTFLFLFFAFAGTEIANNTDDEGMLTEGSVVMRLLFIALAFGFSLAVNAWTFFRISGGLFNPAVTLAMCVIGAVPWVRGGLLFVSQMVGAICSAAVVSGLFPGDLTVQTTLGGGTSIAQGLFIEMFLTFQLVFTIFLLAAEKHKATFIAPVGIGLSLFVAELAGVFFTGGSLNPARSFAPSAIQGGFPSYHWIYWLGPILGSYLAVLVYQLIKMLEYETANPDQDDDGEKKTVVTPEVLAAASRNGSPSAAGQNRASNDQGSITRQTPAQGSGYGYDVGPHIEAAVPKSATRPD